MECYATIEKNEVAGRAGVRGDSPVGPVVKTPPSNAGGTRVQSLVGELRSHMPKSKNKENTHTHNNKQWGRQNAFKGQKYRTRQKKHNSICMNTKKYLDLRLHTER